MKECNLGELLLWMLRLRRRLRVVGTSMQPVLNDGDEVLLAPRAYRRRPPGHGDVVVARHPQRPDLLIIKRIAGIATDGRCQLVGDNPDPLASSNYRVPGEYIRGQVSSRFWSRRRRSD